MIVLLPVRFRSLLASANIFLHSCIPLDVALISTKRLPVTCAITLAMVVLPVPVPPQRIKLGTLSANIKPRSTPLGPTISWPHTSSRVRGLMRSASGATLCNALLALGRFANGSASGREVESVEDVRAVSWFSAGRLLLGVAEFTWVLKGSVEGLGGGCFVTGLLEAVFFFADAVLKKLETC